MKNALTLLIFTMLLFSCNTNTENTIPKASSAYLEAKSPSKGTQIINNAIQAHGGELYDIADYTFIFRAKEYHISNDHSNFSYSVKHTDEQGSLIYDQLINGAFTRTINHKLVDLSQEDQNKYSSSLNSVIYFVLIPYKLNDASVNKTYVEETTIKGEKYHVIEITFAQEGGGEDFDDEYQYWVNQTTNQIDYFAYNYRVNGGGARFRSAYNKRIVDGIVFQDYINWEVDFETPLKDIPTLFEKNELKEASRIELENIIGLPKL